MLTLSAQLSSQLLKFLRKHPDITQKSVADHLGLSPSFLSEIISGKKNFSPIASMRLSQMLDDSAMKMIKTDASVKHFTFKGKALSSHIEHFSSNGGGWVAGQSGVDPASAAIVVVPTG